MKENDKTGTREEKPRKETIISLNKKAYHDFEILNKYDAGIALQGTEIKSLRGLRANITDGYARIRKGEALLSGINIPIYKHGNYTNHEPVRDRKLLLHKSEIRRLEMKLKDKSLTIVPLKLYFSGPFVKIEIGLAKGKKLYDKRESIKKAEVQRKLKRVKI
jgi:SsrA-binding protein